MTRGKPNQVQPGIIVHGGAGRKLDMRAHRRGVRRAILAGQEVLLSGGSALDAVVAAVVVMEDDATFNCGTGSALTLSGKVEMDAAVMSDDLRCGAVGALEGVKNPILVARRVMESSDHVLLVGRGAKRFARRTGFGPYDPVVPRRRKQWKEMIGRLADGRSPPYLPNLSFYAGAEGGGVEGVVAKGFGAKGLDAEAFGAEGLDAEGFDAEGFGTEGFSAEGLGTVGAVARDAGGRLAAATSTGAMMLRLPGRVGDTPVVGAGTYADAHGAVSATGHGEEIIKIVWAARTADLMRRMSAPRAVQRAVQLATESGCRGGLIAIDGRGRVGYGFNTRSMSWAYALRGEVEVF
jgi:beta-aspartyl-peptidase (threonine type)